MELEKQMFCKQMFAGQCRGNGIQNGLSSLRVSPTISSPYSLHLSLVKALFLKQEYSSI